jgi:hypothetical protein
MPYAVAEEGGAMAAGGRGPDESGNNGRGPECEPGNRGRGPAEEGNNGRGPGENGRPCPDEPIDSLGTGVDRGAGGDSGGDSAGGGVTGGTTRTGNDTRPTDGSVDRRGMPVPGGAVTADTVSYYTVRGTMTYEVVSEIVLVDPSGREVNRFTASSVQSGPFERGEFDGDPRVLPLESSHQRFFDPSVLAGQMAEIERAVLEDLAVAIATGTYDQVLAGIQ